MHFIFSICLVLVISILQSKLCKGLNDYNHEDQKYWQKVGREEIEAALGVTINSNTAKNVILFVADGMDTNTVTAARIHKEKERGRLSFEKFPHMGHLKTYSSNKKVPDTAASGTALFTGVKTKNGMVGVDSSAKFEDCASSLATNARVKSIMVWAQDAGKNTGFVTNRRVTDASASALYSHSASRYWECNSSVPLASRFPYISYSMRNVTKDYINLPLDTPCKDIARQLVENEPGRNFKVIFGGGRQTLMSNSTDTPFDELEQYACYRTDNKDLLSEWAKDKSMRKAQYQVVTNTAELKNMDTSKTEFALGIFSNSYLPFEVDRNTSSAGPPSLEMMVQAAIEILHKNNKGFVLMVETGLIDKAHHENLARKAIEETIVLHQTVEKTIKILNDLGLLHETLIIVTGGHGHTMSINGYPDRKGSIFGIAEKSKEDGVPYTTLTYATGHEFNIQYSDDGWVTERLDPSIGGNTTSFDYSQQACIDTGKETHGGGDVAVYASGPMAHLFHSTHESTYVAHVIAYATKIGPYRVRP